MMDDIERAKLQEKILNEFSKNHVTIPIPTIFYYDGPPRLKDKFGSAIIYLNTKAETDEYMFVYELSHELTHVYFRHDLTTEEMFKNIEWYEELLATSISLRILKTFGSSYAEYANKKCNKSKSTCFEKAAICVLENFTKYLKDGPLIYSDEFQLAKHLEATRINLWKMLSNFREYIHSL